MTGRNAAGLRTDALVDIRKATVYRGNTRVLVNFSLTIERHEQVCILGPNGSGKTTLLMLLNRELYPVVAEGSYVKILGRQDWNVRDLRSRIGIVSQDLQSRYRSRTTGLDVILSGYFASIGVHGALARRVSDGQRLKARRIMGELGMQALAATPFAEMSTGQQRRCLLGRALIHEPATLVLDEPTNGLDLPVSFDYLARIRQLVSEGRNIVLVTHLLNEIPPEIERIVMIREGTVVADGPKPEVLTAANLRKTYGVPIRLTEVDGYYLASPAAR